MTEMTFEDQHQVAEGIRRARQIMDDRLRALTLAHRFWAMTQFALREEKMAYAVELDAFGIFSLSQLGKIVRCHKATLAKVLGAKQRPGGRFEPNSLNALALLRKKVLQGETLSQSLIEDLAENGTSVSCACRLIGVNSQHRYFLIRSTHPKEDAA
jgi:hypothetical protein